MPFNQSPSTWLSGYTLTGGTMSFTLPTDRTAEMQDPLAFVYRVMDELARVYKAKPTADLPTRWSFKEILTQPTTVEAVTSRTLTNRLILDASLLHALDLPDLTGVSFTAPDSTYDGYPYNYYTLSYPSGSVVELSFSGDGGLTYQTTAPTSIGIYIARLTVTRDGRTRILSDTFTIQKAPAIINLITPTGPTIGDTTVLLQYFSSVALSTVQSSNSSVLAVDTFTSLPEAGGLFTGIITLLVGAVGTAKIRVRTEATSDFLPAENAIDIEVEKKDAVISAPAVTVTAAQQLYAFATNFPMTPLRYALITFGSSASSKVDITRGSGYPPSLVKGSFGTATITITFAGDQEYNGTSESFVATVLEVPQAYDVTMAVTAPSITAPIVSNRPLQPQTTGLTTNISIGLDINGELYDQVALPYSFNIIIGNQPITGMTAVFTPFQGA